MSNEFTGKTALVAGASRGIGAAGAVGLACSETACIVQRPAGTAALHRGEPRRGREDGPQDAVVKNS